MQSLSKIRTGLTAALTVALLSGTAMATPATAPSNTPPPVRRLRRRTAARRRRPQVRRRTGICSAGVTRQHAQALFQPDEAARREQTTGTVGGTLGGAALGAIVGGASGHAGTGAAIGAGAGLIAGTAIGADNAHRAADDAQQRYASAYYACLDEANGAPPPPGAYAYDVPPPPPYFYGPYPYPYYYRPYYWGPAVTFGFGYHGRHHW